jgi:hypothetical protein
VANTDITPRVKMILLIMCPQKSLLRVCLPV